MKAIRIQKSAIGSAPGVFDFLGGVASHAGGLALQSQTQSQTTILVTEGSDEALSVTSSELGRFETPIAPFKTLVGERAEYRQFANWLDDCKSPAWTRDTLACLALFAIRFKWLPEAGLSFAINSDIPSNQGIGRAVSFQVATLRALEKLTSQYFVEQGLAQLAQEASERILGRLCPSFIPSASAYGKPGCLSQSREGEIELRPPIELPKGVTIIGTPCSFDNSDWVSKREIALSAIDIGKIFVRNTTNQEFDYTTNTAPSKFIQSIEKQLPEYIDGKSILSHFTPSETSQLEIDEDTQYPIQQAFGYVVSENYRSRLASHLLTNLAHNSKRRAVEHLGELMLQSHAYHSRLGLSDDKVDSLISKIREEGPDQGIFGGRITGSHDSRIIIFLIQKKSIKRLRDVVQSIFGPEQSLTL